MNSQTFWNFPCSLTLPRLYELFQHEHIMHCWQTCQYNLSWKLPIQEVIPDSGNVLCYIRCPELMNPFVKLGLSWFYSVVDVALPDRSYLVATLRYLGRWGKSDGTAWEFNSCFYIFSPVPLVPAALNKVLWAKNEQTLELDVGRKLLHGNPLSHFTSSSYDFRGNLCALEFFNVRVEQLDQQPGTAHTRPIASRMYLSKWYSLNY